MFKLPVKLKTNVLNKLSTVKDLFYDELHLIDLLHKGIPVHQFLILQRIRRLNLNKVSDIELIMLCGAFDFAFCAGSYPYSSNENRSLNDLGDAIFELKYYKK